MKNDNDNSESTSETESPEIFPIDREHREERTEWELWNLLTLAAHHVFMRLAWIFKTETVIMPAFLDVIAGAGWIRGCLPVFNRISQSIAPVLASASLRNMPCKVRMMKQTTMLMAFLFGCLSFLCLNLGREEMDWFPAVFLIIYAMFFAATGVNQLSFNTLQGKLIRPHRRGRLMSIAGMAGSLVAMVGAYFLLTAWLAIPKDEDFPGSSDSLRSVLFWPVRSCGLFTNRQTNRGPQSHIPANCFVMSGEHYANIAPCNALHLQPCSLSARSCSFLITNGWEEKSSGPVRRT